MRRNRKARHERYKLRLIDAELGGHEIMRRSFSNQGRIAMGGISVHPGQTQLGTMICQWKEKDQKKYVMPRWITLEEALKLVDEQFG